MNTNDNISGTNGQTNCKQTALRVQDVIGRALPRIGAYKKLDNTKQVVALIDDVRYLIFLIISIVNLTVFNCRTCASIVVNVIWLVMIPDIKRYTLIQKRIFQK